MTTENVFKCHCFEVTKCCHSWTHIYIHKKGKVLQIPRHVVIFRPRDKQEYYMLFGIFAGNTCLYSLSVFYISPEPISNTCIFIYFVYCIIGHLLQGCVMDLVWKQGLMRHDLEWVPSENLGNLIGILLNIWFVVYIKHLW